MPALTPTQSQLVNETCACTSLDRRALRDTLQAQADAAAFEQLPQTHPHLFADTPVYVARAEMAAMEETVAAIERVATLPAYRAEVLARAPAIARQEHGPAGALMGYDFHLTEDGPRLIEINTNAGGAFLNGIACDAQRICCEPMRSRGEIACPADLSSRLVAMFIEEWRLQRGSGRPVRIAIVDDAPQEQYLHPEFLLAKALLDANGITTEVVDPTALVHHSGRLWRGDKVVDLVYNRLVDFDLSAAGHAALRAAYVAGEVVVTPGPRHHALFADKRNLVALSSAPALEALGAAAADRAALARIPRTRLVEASNAEALWAERDCLFFKPVAGHGGKAVYRGDKLTRKAWSTILAGAYVAQERVPPSARLVSLAGEPTRHKVDVRLYTYAGALLLTAARLYQGQTTNFRTPGGGFAPVIVV